MKKLLTLITTLLIASAAFAVDFNFKAWQTNARAGYDANLAYTESVTGIAEGENLGGLTLEQWKLGAIINIKLGAFHGGKDAEFCKAAAKEAKELFYANINKLTDAQVYQIAGRIGDFALAATKFNAVKSSFSADKKISDALLLYKNKALSKETTIAVLIDASDDIIKDNQFVALTKAVNSIPTRGTDGKAFMTREQKKEFYGNFIDLNKVTTASADFLGACVTQYNLVK